MSDRKPLVLGPDPSVPGDASALQQQLQPQDDLDIPLRARVDAQTIAITLLCDHLEMQGLEIPPEVRHILETNA